MPIWVFFANSFYSNINYRVITFQSLEFALVLYKLGKHPRFFRKDLLYNRIPPYDLQIVAFPKFDNLGHIHMILFDSHLSHWLLGKIG